MTTLPSSPRRAIAWLRHDLRLQDQPLWALAQDYDELLCVYAIAPSSLQPHPPGVAHLGEHRRATLWQALMALHGGLQQRQQALHILSSDDPAQDLAALAESLSATVLVADHPGVYERRAVASLRQRVPVSVSASNTLLPLSGPAAPAFVSPFTRFRKTIEAEAAPSLRQLSSAPSSLPPCPSTVASPSWPESDAFRDWSPKTVDARSALPYTQPDWALTEDAALAHLTRYFRGEQPAHYKDTRNGLIGSDYSTKLSAWLASGCVSVQRCEHARRAHECDYGSSDGSYWIFFELLWREYFYALMQHAGARAFSSTGLQRRPPQGAARQDQRRFEQWCSGRTGCDWVDAGMRELAATGYLSNRMRQNVASFLIHDLGVDWRWGAAWFESQLIDFDVCSNQGNWLYLAGVGTDPRDGRRFNPDRQAAMYDPDGQYRALWLR